MLYSWLWVINNSRSFFFILTKEFGMLLGKDRENMLKTLHWIMSFQNLLIWKCRSVPFPNASVFCFNSMTSIAAVVKIQCCFTRYTANVSLQLLCRFNSFPCCVSGVHSFIKLLQLILVV